MVSSSNRKKTTRKNEILFRSFQEAQLWYGFIKCSNPILLVYNELCFTRVFELSDDGSFKLKGKMLPQGCYGDQDIQHIEGFGQWTLTLKQDRSFSRYSPETQKKEILTILFIPRVLITQTNHFTTIPGTNPSFYVSSEIWRHISPTLF